MTTSGDVQAMLDELATLTSLDEESPQSFKVRAYENARRAVEAYPGDVTDLSAGQLAGLDGIGRSTAAKIRELVDTGTVAKLEALRADYPPAFVELSRIPGVGPKSLKLMRSELAIEDLDGLVAAIEAQQLRTLRGMGPTSEAKIARAIDRLGLTGKDRRTPVAQVMPIGQRLVDDLGLVDGVTAVTFCGSLRRMAETIGDLDVTVATREPSRVTEAVTRHPLVGEIILSGDTKTSFLTARGLQVDVRVVAPEQFGAATLYFTGSKAHNIALRQRAIERGLLLNEYGLFPHERGAAEPAAGEPVAATTEEDIYRALGLPWIPPPMREGTGELAAADAGNLPDVVTLADIKGDLHYHTDRSGDGRAPLEDMVKVAADRGYAYLAITDHGEDLAINGSTAAQMLEHRDAIRALQSSYPDMTLLFGCELNIGADGGLDYDADFRAGFDYTVASVHSSFDQPVRAQTARLVRAISDPTVNAIGHLTGRYIGRRPGIEIDVDIVLEALFRFDVALEINGALDRLDANADVVRRAVERGVKLVIDTDSHHTSELGRMEWGVLTAQRGWVPRDLVVNTWEPDRFLTWVAEHRRGGTGH
ncbi:MAG: DNA polymerase/3'-5' exonuclease PolX [Acidimicrobiales bacterium]